MLEARGEVKTKASASNAFKWIILALTSSQGYTHSIEKSNKLGARCIFDLLLLPSPVRFTHVHARDTRAESKDEGLRVDIL